LLVGFLALIVGILAACSGGQPGAVAPGTVTVTAQPPAEPVVTVTAQPSVEPAPTLKPKVEKAPAPADVTFTMPALVGMVLQDAQDLLQTKGSYVMDQQDARGLERLQVLDANWKVCSQSPKKGTNVATDTTIVVRSVKLIESCP
jgi:PASTA domain